MIKSRAVDCVLLFYFNSAGCRKMLNLVSLKKRTTMPPIINQRMTVKMEGDFVVFLIGMRVNKILKIHINGSSN